MESPMSRLLALLNVRLFHHLGHHDYEMAGYYVNALCDIVQMGRPERAIPTLLEADDDEAVERLLLIPDLSLDTDESQVLFSVALHGNFDLVERLVLMGANITARGGALKTVLMQHDDNNSARLRLLDRMRDVRVVDPTPEDQARYETYHRTWNGFF